MTIINNITQNDISAKYYDLIYSPYKPKCVTDAEVSLIKNLVPRNGKILDIACGTGRHLIPLSKLGYRVLGVDISEEMLKKVKSKLKTARVIKTNIFKAEISEKFDLIILMWNAFNEIVFDKKEAIKLIKILKNFLNLKGKILLNIENAGRLKLSNLNFNYKLKKNDRNFELKWKLVKYLKRTNTTICEEIIIVKDKKNKIIDRTKAFVKQRWWRYKEIKEIAKSLDLKYRNLEIKYNKEFYIVLE